MFDTHATSNPRLEACAKSSFYRLVDTLWGDARGSREPIHRFLSLMRIMGATHFVREALESNPELDYERASVGRRCGKQVELRPTRLTFFWAADEAHDWNDEQRVPTDSVAGYAVVVWFRAGRDRPQAYLLEAVVRPPCVGRLIDGKVVTRPINRYFFLHCTREFTTRVGAAKGGGPRDFTLKGSFFTQQNGVTHVCAHAAVRMALNSTTLFTQKKVTVRDLNDLLGLTFTTPATSIGAYEGAPPPSREPGLRRDEIQSLIQRYGAWPNMVNCKSDTDTEYDQFTYPYMESGWPVILGLEGVDINNGTSVKHVVTILGHSLNVLRWAPEARAGYGMLPQLSYMPAADWSDHFIINDDGYGMYQTLQADIVRNIVVPSKNASLHALFAIALVPQRVTFAGLNAETVAATSAANFIQQVTAEPDNYWLAKLKEVTSSSKFVCRTLWQEKTAYLAQFKAAGIEGFTSTVRKNLEDLPEHFWVTEITMPPLYTANGKKLGEVLVRADVEHEPKAGKKPFGEMLLAWLPGVVLFAPSGRPAAWPVREPLFIIGAENLLATA